MTSLELLRTVPVGRQSQHGTAAFYRKDDLLGFTSAVATKCGRGDQRHVCQGCEQ